MAVIVLAPMLRAMAPDATPLATVTPLTWMVEPGISTVGVYQKLLRNGMKNRAHKSAMIGD